jgi:multidrug efflux pump subunit AcrB
MLMGFLVIDGLGFTLNMIVLFSLILALGMLVDNAIVVVENIYRHMEEGKDRVTAAIEGTREVGMAVAASTATTVVAFFPLVFWTGIMGEFMGYLPKTIIILLICSLVVALGVLPVFTALFLKPPADGAERREDREPSVWMMRYKKVLQWSIRHRYRSAAAGFLLLIGTFIAFGALNHGTEFFPNTEPDRATISIRAPDGTDLETTDRIVRQVESILVQERNIDVFVAETGMAGGGRNLAGAHASPNQARITVDFRPHRNQAEPGEEARVESTRATIARLRRYTEQIVGAEITVDQEVMGPPVGAPVGVEVAGEEFHAVGELARKVRRLVAEIPGVTDLTDDYRVGRPELRLRIDRAGAKRVGVTSAAVGNAIRSAVAGALATTFREGDEETDIVVSVAPRFREDLQGVLDLRLPGRDDRSPDTYPIPLSTVASYELAGGTGSIHHVDQDLVVTLEGDVRTGFNENAVRAQVADVLEAYDTPEGFQLRLGGADDEQRQAASFLSRAFLLGVAGILMVLVTQFNSLAIPLIILATVVLSLIGVLWGLVLTGLPFGIVMTGLGVISLAGVVVNNAIVLLDYVEKLRDQGLETEAALVQAGMTRFRPVMLTAVTTVLGLFPMAIGLSVDLSGRRLLLGGSSAQWWGPMAVAVIFGLTLATVRDDRNGDG